MRKVCREEVTRRLRAGEAQSDVAQACGVSKQRVQQIARQLGISGRRDTNYYLAMRAQTAERKSTQTQAVKDKKFFFWERTVRAAVLRCQGLSWTQIAEQLDCDRARICNMVLAEFPALYVGRGNRVS